MACAEAGAVVTLDGRYLFTASGTAEQYLLPGEHQLAATKPGLRTAFATFTGVAGRNERHELRPVPELGQPRWRYWKHVLGGGVGFAAAGTLAYLWARSDYAAFDTGFVERCPQGCTEEELNGFPELLAIRDRARTKQAVALSLFAVGGAGILAGLLGLILDQPRVRPEPRRAVPSVTAVRGGATLGLGWTF